MLEWLAGMTHPDGELAFFNDAAASIAPNFGARDVAVKNSRLPDRSRRVELSPPPIPFGMRGSWLVPRDTARCESSDRALLPRVQGSLERRGPL